MMSDLKMSYGICYLAIFIMCVSHCSGAWSQASSLDIGITHASIPCPCSNPKWCEPIKVTYEREVFAFSVRNNESHWKLFDWSKLTTVVMFGYMNEKLMCLAHSNNVRVVLLGGIKEETFLDPDERKKWIMSQLLVVKNNFLDGINFDFESAILANETDVRDAYTALVKETKTAFARESPFYQVSVDVAWKPNVDLRFYDYAGLAEAADFLFVMAYDEQSQIFGECIAGPNSALGSAKDGLTAYLQGYNGTIQPSSLILGVPWYGYIYPCIGIDGDKCFIKKVPFRGVNCSDAAGREYDYSFIHNLMTTMPGKFRWNATSATPFLTFADPDKNQSYQVQFDDPRSLKLKYDLAVSMGVRGVGMWNIDALDYSDTDTGKEIRESMFGALPLRVARPEDKVKTMSRSSPAGCPCSDPRLCEPIKEMGRKEVFAFSVSNDESHWSLFDWSKITTVCMAGYINTSLMCLAHSHNARVTYIAGGVDEKTFMNVTLRKQWIQKQLEITRENYLDGINFDFETRVSPEQKDISEAYADLVNETSIALKSMGPYYQISVDTIDSAYSKYRAYDYQRLYEASDFLFIMAYDESGYGLVGPNSALPAAKYAIKTFVENHMGADKLVLGVPWYGYVYECSKLVEDDCILEENQASQVGYATLYYLQKATKAEIKWDSLSSTPYFSYTDSTTNKSYQVQYDDPYSLKLKYDLAAQSGLRGVGLWHVDCLDFSDTEVAQNIRDSMFGVLPSRTAASSSNSLHFKSEMQQHHVDILSDVPYAVDDVKAAPVGLNGIDEVEVADVQIMTDNNDISIALDAVYEEVHVDVSAADVNIAADGELLPVTASAACPCSDPKLCEPIKDTTRKEVYAFSVKNDENHWLKYDWSKITTICLYGYVNTSLMCLAHSHNVRAVTLGAVKVITMITPALRKQWIAEQLAIVKDNFLDGLNFDVEETIHPDQTELRDAYTALVTETYQAFKKELPYSQISIDVIHDAYSVNCAYDYPGLAAASDFLFIMAYDEYGYGQVGPDSDIIVTTQAIDSYIKSNISADKLVLGLPWYGYVYDCATLVGDKCSLNKSIDPSIRQAKQVFYPELYYLLQTMPENYRWNATSLSPYFSYTDPNTQKSYQVQYDDPESLKYRYDLAAKKNIRGVGMWTIDFLDFSDTAEAEKMRRDMFRPLPPKPAA